MDSGALASLSVRFFSSKACLPFANQNCFMASCFWVSRFPHRKWNCHKRWSCYVCKVVEISHVSTRKISSASPGHLQLTIKHSALCLSIKKGGGERIDRLATGNSSICRVRFQQIAIQNHWIDLFFDLRKCWHFFGFRIILLTSVIISLSPLCQITLLVNASPLPTPFFCLLSSLHPKTASLWVLTQMLPLHYGPELPAVSELCCN